MRKWGSAEASRCAATAASSAGLAVSLNNFAITQSRQQDIRPAAVDNRFFYDVNLFNVNADQTHVLFEQLENATTRKIQYWILGVGIGGVSRLLAGRIPLL